MGKQIQNRNKTVSEERREQIRAIKAKEKKLVKKLIVIILATGVVSGVLWFVFEQFGNHGFEGEVKGDYTVYEQVHEVYPSITPYPADFDKDLSDYHPNIMYVYEDGGTYSVSITDIPEESRNEAHRFFLRYFDVLKSGDSDSYGSLFSKTYKKAPKGFEKDFTRKFPPQELYDITVVEVQRSTDTRVKNTYEGKECFFGYYKVSYKIRENDGYFRRDLYREEIERPLYFELVTFNKDTDKEVTYIKNMYTESSIKKIEE